LEGNVSTSKIEAVNIQQTKRDGAGELTPWDTEWAVEKAGVALRYLGRNYPECLENLRVLDQPETAAYEAALRGDRDAYLEALRGYMRAGRDEAMRIRRGAA
jgi:hypothetical protein